MIGWLATPVGRLLQGTIGIALLWIGISQVTVLGLMVMLTGLIAAVLAAAPPPFVVAAPVHSRRRPDGIAR